MSTLIKRTLLGCWWTLAAAVILAAVLLGVARIVLPTLGSYRADVEGWLSDYLQRTVSVERLDMRWAGWRPQLTIEGLRIVGPGGDSDLLVLGKAYLDADLWGLLRGGAEVVRNIELSGFPVQVSVTEEGSVQVQGARVWPAGAAPDTDAVQLLALLATPRRISLSGLSIDLHDRRDGRHYRARDVSLRVANRGERHTLHVEVPLPAELGRRVALTLDLSGAPETPAAWSGNGHLALRGIDLQGFAGLGRALPVSAAGGALDAELWLDWGGATVQALAGTVRMRGLRLRSAADTPLDLVLDSVSATADWRRLGDGWHARIEDLLLPGAGGVPTRGQVRWRQGSAGARLDGDWGQVDLGELTRWAEFARSAGAAFPALERFVDAHPRGTLRDLRFDVALAHGDQVAEPLDAGGAAFDARFAQLSVRPWASVPGFEGLSGTVAVRAGLGRLDLDAESVLMEVPGLFRAPLSARELQGSVGFELAGGVDVWSPRVDLVNADVAARTRFAISWAAGRPLFMDIQADFRDGDARATPRYLPIGIMNENLVEWLDNGIREGRVIGGSALVYGPADTFPYRGGDGVFQVDFEVEDAVLAYQEGWPDLSGVAAHVRFAQAGLDIEAHRGTLLGAQVRRARARFADLRDGVLEVDGEVDGDLAQQLRFVRESPLQQALGPFLGEAEGSGPVRVVLALRLPVADVDAFSVTGTVAFEGAELRAPAWNLDLRRLQGTLDFDRQGIGIETLRAEVNGQPATIAARRVGASTRFRVEGRFGAADLLGEQLAQLTPGVSGRAPWTVGIDVPSAGAGALEITARSSLVGTAVSLPAPLSKPAAEPAALEVRLRFTQAGRALRVHVDYQPGLRADLQLLRRGGRLALQAGSVVYGNPSPTAGPGRGELHVDLDLPELDLDGWLALLGGWPGQASGQNPLRRFTLRTREVRFRQRALGELAVTANRRGRNWSIGVANAALRGSLAIPAAHEKERPVRVTVQYLDLEPFLPPAGAGGEGESAGGLAPDDLPPVELSIAELRVAGARLDNVRLRTRPHSQHVSIEEFGFDNRALRLYGQGDWRVGDDGRHNSRVEFRLESDDWGAALATLGFPETLRGGRGNVAGELSWKDAAYRPRLAGLDGNIRLRLANGVLLDAEPGLARFIGLFSIQALPRRLSLDFKDFVAQGFEFDSLEGSVDLVEGTAYTRGMRMRGTVGRVEVSGSSDLVAQTYAQKVVVTPNLSASLPLVGELAVPGSGLTVLLLGSVLKGIGVDIERIGELQYTLTGPWSDPVLAQLRPETPAQASPTTGDR